MIKKSFSLFVCYLFVSIIFAPANVFWSTQSDYINKIESLHATIDNVYWKMPVGGEQARSYQKKESIDELLNQTKEKIKNEENTQIIESTYNTTLRKVLVKAFSIDSPRVDFKSELEEYIEADKRDEAFDTLKQSLINEDWEYEIIVKSENPLSQIELLLSRIDNTVSVEKIFSVEWNNFFKLLMPPDSIIKKHYLDEIEHWVIPSDLFSKVDVIKPSLMTIWQGQTDSWFLDWEQLSSLWWIEKIGAHKFQEWLNSDDVKKVKVGVIDSWIDHEHQDLKENISDNYWYNFFTKNKNTMDTVWHWTHVAWTIWAVVNWNWVFGVNSNVELVPLKTCGTNWCPTNHIVAAVNYAVENWIDVVNLSLWWPWSASSGTFWCSAVQHAYENWVVVVASAGNENANVKNYVPAWCEHAISVAAVNENIKKAWFSNYWELVDFAAPWQFIYSTEPWNNYGNESWTSMAAPHVSGLVSAILAYKEKTPSEIIELLKNTSYETERQNQPIGKMIDMTKTMSAIWVLPDWEEWDEEESDTYSLNWELSISNKSPKQWSSVTLSVDVYDQNNESVQGANVTYNLDAPNWNSLSWDRESDENWTAELTLNISENTVLWTFSVSTQITKDSYEDWQTDDSSFTIVEKESTDTEQEEREDDTEQEEREDDTEQEEREDDTEQEEREDDTEQEEREDDTEQEEREDDTEQEEREDDTEQEDREKWLVEIYYFWWEWCPACNTQNDFWNRLKQNEEINEKISINRYEVYRNRTNYTLFNKVWQELWVQTWAVPITFIWKDSFVWAQTDSIQDKINKCIEEGCNDVVGRIIK